MSDFGPDDSGPLGTRRARLVAQRRRRRSTTFAVIAALLLVGVFGVVVVPLMLRSGRDLTPVAAEAVPSAPAGGLPTPPVQSRRTTLLLIESEEPEEPATTLTLLSAAGADSQAAVVFVPAGLLVDIPGFGLDRLTQATRYGDADLAARAVEQALGIDVSSTATISRADLPALLGATGPLPIDVGSEPLADGDVRFAAGEQELDGQALAQYWGLTPEGEAPLAGLPRQQAVLEALLRRLNEEPSQLDALLRTGVEVLSTDAREDDLRGLFSGLASAQVEERLAFRLLPVAPVGPASADGEGSYRLTDDAAEEIAALLALGPPPEDGATRVQVLNATGEPDVIQAVDRLLSEDEGLRIVLTDTAPEPVAETEIVVYEDTELMRARAEEVRERLGTGTITASSRPRSVIDITVVVGADFTPPRLEP